MPFGDSCAQVVAIALFACSGINAEALFLQVCQAEHVEARSAKAPFDKLWVTVLPPKKSTTLFTAQCFCAELQESPHLNKTNQTQRMATTSLKAPSPKLFTPTMRK
jgi:hypothetical protein